MSPAETEALEAVLAQVEDLDPEAQRRVLLAALAALGEP